ncbi:MAG: hypothetical protein ACOZNI_02880, partial [Myxococcota bacterium]
ATPRSKAPPAAAPKIVPRTVSAAAKPPPAEEDDVVPPSVKGKPAAPKGGPQPRKMLGARSPDETGMLQMVPLSDNEDEKEAGADPSATAFFAIPAPKSERPKATASMAPPPNPTATMTPSTSGPPQRPGFQPPPYQPTPIAGPTPGMGGGGTPPPQAIAGPVAGYGGGTPFQVAGPQPTANNNAESRVQSARVYAIVLAVFMLACVAVLSVIALWFFVPKPDSEKKEEVVAVAEVKKPAKTRDTGAPAPKEQPTAAPTAPKKPKSTGTSAPAAPRLGASAPVTVTFAGSPTPAQVEVVCSGGFRQRKGVSGGSVTVDGVPTADNCQLHPKGGITATSAPVRGGGRYTCSIIGTTTSCK